MSLSDPRHGMTHTTGASSPQAVTQCQCAPAYMMHYAPHSIAGADTAIRRCAETVTQSVPCRCSATILIIICWSSATATACQFCLYRPYMALWEFRCRIQETTSGAATECRQTRTLCPQMWSTSHATAPAPARCQTRAYPDSLHCLAAGSVRM